MGEVEVLIVGAGPAGIGAAAETTRHGLQTVLVDSREQPGGQFYARPTGAAWAGLPDEVTEGLNLDYLEMRPASEVWAAFPDMTFGVAGPYGGELFRPRCVVLATGAFEAPIPFPGWDAAGVISAGAAQLMVKESLAVPSGRVVVAGSGPFLLVVASQLVQAGAQVTAVIEAVHTLGHVRMLPALAMRPRRATETLRYLLRLRGVNVERGRKVLAVESGCLICDGKRHPFDVLCVGHGFKPRLELSRLLGCEETRLGVRVDHLQQTTISCVWAAGEVTGIGGVELSHSEGRVAGLAIADQMRGIPADSRRRLRTWVRRRRLAASFASTLRSVFARPEPLAAATDATCICRCESVTLGTMRRVAQVAPEGDIARSLKALLRCGMGPCQGATCWDAIESFVGGIEGTPPRPRLPVGVVRVGTLAESDKPVVALGEDGRK